MPRDRIARTGRLAPLTVACRTAVPGCDARGADIPHLTPLHVYACMRIESAHGFRGRPGASGYGGGELLRLLADHRDLQVTRVWANASAGADRRRTAPHVATLADLEVTTFEPGDVDVDFVFMALPHSQSAQYADALSTPVVDLGADFRLHDPSAWRRYYGTGHAGTWTYGLPELPGRRTQIAASKTVANPGCYATAITLAAAPWSMPG